jgi:hypothetical protein
LCISIYIRSNNKNTTRKIRIGKKAEAKFFYLRTSTTNRNFRGLPGAVDKLSVDDVVLVS